jgi:hypothetical protein
MNEVIKVDGVPESKITALSTNANSFLEQAKQQKAISNDAQLQAVGHELVRIKDVRAQVVELFADPKKKAHEAHKAICDSESKLLKPLNEAESTYSRMMSAYRIELQRKAEEERLRSQREAEEKVRKEREALLAKAEKQLDIGNDEKAAELIEKSEQVIPIPTFDISYEPPKVAGLNFKSNWTFEVIDINQVPREYMMVDEKKIGAVVKAMKKDTNIPGIKVYDTGSVAKAS